MSGYVCVCKHSAMAGDWLMAEQVQDAPWLLQIGTAESWQWKCCETHTHTHTYRTYTTHTHSHLFFFSYTRPMTEYPRMGRLSPTCPPHLVDGWTCQVSFLNARMERWTYGDRVKIYRLFLGHTVSQFYHFKHFILKLYLKIFYLREVKHTILTVHQNICSCKLISFNIKLRQRWYIKDLWSL